MYFTYVAEIPVYQRINQESGYDVYLFFFHFLSWYRTIVQAYAWNSIINRLKNSIERHESTWFLKFYNDIISDYKYQEDKPLKKSKIDAIVCVIPSHGLHWKAVLLLFSIFRYLLYYLNQSSLFVLAITIRYQIDKTNVWSDCSSIRILPGTWKNPNSQTSVRYRCPRFSGARKSNLMSDLGSRQPFCRKDVILAGRRRGQNWHKKCQKFRNWDFWGFWNVRNPNLRSSLAFGWPFALQRSHILNFFKCTTGIQ